MPERVRDFLDPLSIRVIPGVGPKSEAFLHEQNIRTVKELSEIPEAMLTEWFGKWGQRLFEKAKGIDDAVVSNEWTRKSVGEQETFAEDTHNPSLVRERLGQIAERVISKLLENEFTGFRTITLTVRFSGFETKNRSYSIKDGIVVADREQALRLLEEQAVALLLPFFDARENPRGKAIRLIGLRLEKLF
jgi:nucleotidyltransferase/DNA polymerase involved in DNA repair